MDFNRNGNFDSLTSKDCIQYMVKDPAPVRNLHILLNSSRVSSFFKKVLDSFKHDRFL